MESPVDFRLQALLVEIAERHSIDLPAGGVSHLAEDDRDVLLDALLQEFSRVGLESDDEPNQRGLDIEELIDIVGSIAAQSCASSE